MLLFAVLIPVAASADQEHPASDCPIEEYVQLTDPEAEDEDRPDRILDGRGGMPFFRLDTSILATVGVVVWCNGDAEPLRNYWRSYRDYYGCSEASDIGQTLEGLLLDLPYHPLYRDAAERLAELPGVCEYILACEQPTDYVPSRFYEDFQCQFDEEAINRAAREASK